MSAAALASLLLALQDPGAAPARPDVLLVTLDTTRRDFMGFLGRSPSPTPHLDALAATSIVFEDAVTTAPLTLPAHGSLLTGLYPLAHGLHDNSLYRLPEEARTLAEILHDAGYATRAAVAAFVLDPVFGLDQGFERYLAPPRGLSTTRTLHFTERGAKEMVDLALEDLAQLAAPAAPAVDGRPRRPFFYWLHLFDPHSPYRPATRPSDSELPAGDPIARARRLYEAEIAGMDAELGRLLAELERRGLAERTLVVVAADHGEGLGDGRETTHGHFLFDPVVRVPLLVRDPRLAPARVAAPASLVDVAPTLLARLGVDAPDARFDGVDLSPWMRDPTLPPPDRVLLLESWYVWLHYGWAPFEGATSGPLKFVRSHGRELFDRASDGDESKNLFAPDDERARGLERRLAQAQQRSAAVAHERGATAAPGLSAADLQALQALGYATGGASDAPPAGDWTELPDAYGKLDVIRGFDDVANAIEREQYDVALGFLRALVAKEPESALFHEQLGLMLINLDPKNAEEAAAELRKTLELDPRNSRAWFGLARCGIARRDAARAELKRRRESGEAGALKPLVQAEREQAQLAEEALRECLRLEPSYPEGLLTLARVLFDEAERAARQHDGAKARALYDEVERLTQRLEEAVPPDSPEAEEARKAKAVARARRDQQ